MTKFNETAAAAEFIATAASRETSLEVMRAIAFFARNEAEAEALWEGSAIGTVANLSDIWEAATENGQIDAEALNWGDRTLAEIVADAEAA